MAKIINWEKIDVSDDGLIDMDSWISDGYEGAEHA